MDVLYHPNGEKSLLQLSPGRQAIYRKKLAGILSVLRGWETPESMGWRSPVPTGGERPWITGTTCEQVGQPTICPQGVVNARAARGGKCPYRRLRCRLPTGGKHVLPLRDQVFIVDRDAEPFEAGHHEMPETHVRVLEEMVFSP